MSGDLTPKFSEIDTSRKTPRNEWEVNDTTALGLPSTKKKILMLAPLKASGSAGDGDLIESVSSPDDAEAYCGIVAREMYEWLLKGNSVPDVDLLCIDEPTGTAAGGSITFATAAEADGVIKLFFGAYEVDVEVTTGDTPAEIATAAYNAVAANAKCPVVGSSPSDPTFEYDYSYDGTLGNYVRTTVIIPDDMKTTATVVQLGSGATDPTFGSTYADVVKNLDYDLIICPWKFTSTSLAALKTLLRHMRHASRAHDALCLVGIADTYANAQTYQATVEDRSFSILFSKATTYLPVPPHLVACYEAGIISAEGNPSVPFVEDERPALWSPLESGTPPNDTEVENCMDKGLSCYRVKASGAVEVVQLLTAATKLDGGTPSDLWASPHVGFVMKYFRKALDERFDIVFSTREARLMDDTKLGDVKAQVLAVAYELADPSRKYFSKSKLDENVDKIIVRACATNVKFVEIGVPAAIIPEYRGTLGTLFMLLAVPKS